MEEEEEVLGVHGVHVDDGGVEVVVVGKGSLQSLPETAVVAAAVVVAEDWLALLPLVEVEQ